MCMAARAMAAAVLRPTGSARTCLRADAGKCLRTDADCSALVTVQMRSAGINGSRRATVCCSMEFAPMMLSSCLGVRVRLRGQKRVPRPPARITACAVSFSAAMSGSDEAHLFDGAIWYANVRKFVAHFFYGGHVSAHHRCWTFGNDRKFAK